MRKSTLQDCSHYSLVGKFICYICFQSFVCILMPMPNFVIMHIQVMLECQMIITYCTNIELREASRE